MMMLFVWWIIMVNVWRAGEGKVGKLWDFVAKAHREVPATVLMASPICAICSTQSGAAPTSRRTKKVIIQSRQARKMWMTSNGLGTVHVVEGVRSRELFTSDEDIEHWLHVSDWKEEKISHQNGFSLVDGDGADVLNIFPRFQMKHEDFF